MWHSQTHDGVSHGDPSCLALRPWWIMLACTVNISTANVSSRRDFFDTVSRACPDSCRRKKALVALIHQRATSPTDATVRKNTLIASAVRYKVGSAPKAHFITFRAKTFSWSWRKIAVACWIYVERIIYRLIRNKMIFHIQANRVRWWVLWCKKGWNFYFKHM